MLGVEVVDLNNGTKRVVHEDPHICNPHTQFDQVDSNQILVQHNRGCEFSKDREAISSLGLKDVLYSP